tara:strand:- start:246 stop:527 length:282 start_codon:yes stop_codon:yes gene_type:complete
MKTQQNQKNKMDKKKETQFKIVLDNILIYNLYILITGAIFLACSVIQSMNGSSSLYSLFQKLWYPIYIPSLSLFFTAILIEGIFNRVLNSKKK